MSRDEGPGGGAARQREGARRGGRGRDGHPQRPVRPHGDHATKGMAQRQPSVLTSGQILKMVPREGSLIPKAKEARERRQEDEGSKANVLAPGSVDRWGVRRPRLEAERPAAHPTAGFKEGRRKAAAGSLRTQLQEALGTKYRARKKEKD